MDLNEMAEEHKNAKQIEYAAPITMVSRSEFEEMYPSKPDARFKCDKMNKAFADVFGGGK